MLVKAQTRFFFPFPFPLFLGFSLVSSMTYHSVLVFHLLSSSKKIAHGSTYFSITRQEQTTHSLLTTILESNPQEE
jgi:hypothetical protein